VKAIAVDSSLLADVWLLFSDSCVFILNPFIKVPCGSLKEFSQKMHDNAKDSLLSITNDTSEDFKITQIAFCRL